MIWTSRSPHTVTLQAAVLPIRLGADSISVVDYDVKDALHSIRFGGPLFRGGTPRGSGRTGRDLRRPILEIGSDTSFFVRVMSDRMVCPASVLKARICSRRNELTHHTR